MKQRILTVAFAVLTVACSAPAATPTPVPPTTAPAVAAPTPTAAQATATPVTRTSPSTASVDWPQANFDYANTRAATNNSISAGNVGQLGVAWTFGVAGGGTYGTLSTSPVVVNGTVDLQDLKSNVYAIDLQTGTLKWQKSNNADDLGPSGPAVDGGKVFVESNVQTVAALDATTGAEVWSTQIATVDTQGIDQQIAAYGGTLYVSTVPGTGRQHFYPGGGMGIIYALDEQTGSVKWSFNTVKDGDLWGHPDVNSGGGAWYPPAIDTSTGMTYWGTGNPAPFPGTAEYPNGSSRPGPNLYTNSAIALDASGQLQWYQQPKSHDLTDADFEASPILATVAPNGASRSIVVGSGKAGYVAGFDKQTGELLWRTAVGIHQNDDLESFPTDSTVTVLPGVNGGVETPTTTLQATAGAQVTLQYTINSTLPHDWHLFDGPDANAPSIAQTPIKSGPGDVATVQFTAPPQPGRYFYQCDVHPTMMTGHLVVN